MNIRAALRAEYDLYRHAAWEQAVADTNGYLLSDEGKAAGISEERLWEIDEDRAIRYASEELLDWWGIGDCRAGQAHGRLTWEEYRDQAEREMPWAHVSAEPYPKTFYQPRVVLRDPDGTETVVALTCEHMAKWGHDSHAAALRCARNLANQQGVNLAA